MRRILLFLLFAGSVSATGCATQASVKDGIPEIDAIFAAWDQPGSPGCAIAVAQDGDVIYSRGFGYANLDYDIPITPQTVFDIASVTKQFNAAIVTMLAQEGKLSLDDDVRKWLPELPAFDQPITLRHMMYHTSGLRDYLNLFPLAGRGDYYPISHEQILDMMSRQQAPVFPPGDRYRYSNTAYMLLAQVIERASGKPVGEQVKERIFEPLGMTGSYAYDDFEQIIPHRGIGYAQDESGELRIVHNYNFDVVGDGQLYSTMEDLLRWDNYLHGGKPDIYPQMLTEGYLNNGEGIGYAQGIVLGEYRGLRTVGHSGSSWGFRTQLVRFVEPALSIAVSCNQDGIDAGRLAQQVADHLLAEQLSPLDEGMDADEREQEKPAEPQQLTADLLEEFSGEYYSPELHATYRFAVTNSVLVVRIEQDPPLNVVAISDNVLEIRFGEQGLSGPQTASLAFDAGRETFTLSSGTERGLLFERR
jgi:CubicO group peptidase (beta-lactamase class C family)